LTTNVTAAAGNAYSTPRDMARYLAALTGGGANEHGRVLEPATLATMFEPQYQPDPRIAGLGLAFWRVDDRGTASSSTRERCPASTRRSSSPRTTASG